MKKNTLDQKIDRLEELLVLQQKPASKIPLKIVHDICDNERKGHEILLSILMKRCSNKHCRINFIDGLIFELLLQSKNKVIINQLMKEYPVGIVPLESGVNIDYSVLQQLLLEKKFQEADQLTQRKLCDISNAVNQHSRSWLYFTDISLLPASDLNTIDQLWQVHSRGLFGVSVQRSIWLANNANWEKFWKKIGWKVGNVACRYPQEFTWDINAPAGHLPLFNQLRGVQVLAALFNHPVWIDKIE